MEHRFKQLIKPCSTLLSVLFIAILLIFNPLESVGRNFYFSASNGNDSYSITQAQNTATPWKSINKLNSIFTTLLPGDSVLFKRGESFYGSIIVGKSGTSALPIVIGAYGIGANPVITGFTTLTAWTPIGNGIYESAATTCKPALNMVTINGDQKAKGRYPNTGYLKFESHTGNTSITDNELTGTPNWTGAVVVIRKNRYTLGRNLITNHTNGSITYSGGGDVPIDNYGYFIQNDIRTLDVLGEWYLNPTSKRLQVFFGSENPSTFVIKASTIDTLVFSNTKSFVSFTNLSFEGANATAFYVKYGQNISITSCVIDFSGGYAVYSTVSDNFNLAQCLINHTNHEAILSNNTNTSIRYNTIKNTGVLQGMANGQSGSYHCIELIGGDGTIIEYNVLDSIGGHGMFSRGNNTIVKNNLINHFAYLLDDVGGIYTGGSAYAGRKILGNIILNGLGDISGTTYVTTGTKGIFLEVNSAFIEIKDNTVANCSLAGMHFNNSHDIIVHNNLCYNNGIQFNTQSSTSIPNELTRNLSIFRNVFFAKTATQTALKMYSVNNDIALCGTADSNYYCRPMDDNSVFYTQVGSSGIYRTLAGWQTYTGLDPHSKKSPQSITNVNDLFFDYNASTVNKVIPLSAIYLGVDGTVYTNTITLAPYKSVVLIKSVNQNTNQPPVILNQNFQLNENSPNGTNVGTVIATDPNVGQILTYSILSGNTNGAFTINTATGVLQVASSAVLNFETDPLFTLVIKVQDNGSGNLSSQATVTINLINVNELPIISNQYFSVITNSAVGTLVGTVVASDPDAGQTKTFSIQSGNTGNAFAISSTTGIITVANPSAINVTTNPSFTLTVQVQDNGTGSLSNQALMIINVLGSYNCSATGNISYQVWNNLGTSVSVSSLTSNINFPDNPSSSTYLTSMEAASNSSSEFGARIAGYICAPLTGYYTFWIASDDNGELWLSTNNQEINKQKIAYHTGYTLSRQWNKYTTQKSAAIYLTQGQQYFIEALMKEATGSDNFAIGWLKPGQSGTVPSEVVPGAVLSPLETVQTFPVTAIILPATASAIQGFDITLPVSVLPGNATNSTLSWTTSNASVAEVDNNGIISCISAGTAAITAFSTDGSNLSAVCNVTVIPMTCSATGNITYQLWQNITGGVAVSNLTSNINYPNNPTSTSLITSVELPVNQGDNFGVRIAGYICAPVSGSYTFWIAGDDNVELWLSSDNQPANKQKIAYHTGFTLSRQWNKYATQKSGTINLIQGQSYYLEVLMKEATGNDNLAVGWLKPGQTGTEPSEVIPGSVLSPIDAVLTTPVTSVTVPSTMVIESGSSSVISATVLPSNATNNILAWASSNTAVATVDNTGLVIGISAGTASITASSTDGSNKSGSCLLTVNPVICSAVGNITYEVWNNIGSSVAISSLTSNVNYPNNPSSTSLLSTLEATSNQGDNFGARITGYICAPATGSYTFWIASDDNGELWLSTDNQPVNKQKIAYHTGYTLSRQWNKYVTQKSAIINLVQGRSYYIEVLMKEATGGDNLAVGWLKPGQTGTEPSEVIPGSVLSPTGTKSKEMVSEPNSSFSQNIELLVYPNPVSGDVINIKLQNASLSIARLEIYSITGVKCYSDQISNSEVVKIDKSLLKSGIYTIRVFDNQFVKTAKLIVK